MPDSAHTVTCTSPAGRANAVPGCPRDATSIKSCHIGPAPVTPLIRIIGSLFALPVQTPVAISGVKPTVQLSRQSVVVPVLTDAGRPRLRTLFWPNADARAALSDSISATNQAIRGSMTSAAGSDV